MNTMVRIFSKAAPVIVLVSVLALSACSGPQIDYQLDRAWANAAKGIRQCQKADRALLDGDYETAGRHFDRALSHLETAVEHLTKAEGAANVRAGNLVDEGDQQLQKAIEKYEEGDIESAKEHYEKALEKYDEALNLIE